MDAVGPNVDVPLSFQGPFAPGLVLLFPARLEPDDRGGRQPWSVWPEKRLEGLREIARAHALEIEPGDQFLEAFGLTQVGGQNCRGELLALFGGATVVHAGLLDLDRSNPREDCPLGEVAVAHDLLPTVLIPEVGMLIDPGADLRMDRLRKELAGAFAKDLGEDIRGGCDWPVIHDRCRLVHGGELLGLVGQW